MNPIKENLQKLYLHKWDAFAKRMSDQKTDDGAMFPHLLSINDEQATKWEKAELRVIVFGMSTNGWGKEFIDQNLYNLPAEEAINKLMNLYERFYFEDGNWKYGQVFWNYIYCIREILQFRLNKNVEFMWNNVVKTFPGNYETEKEYFQVISDEIQILNPDVIILMGLGYVHHLFEILSSEQYDEVGEDVHEDEIFLFSKFSKADLTKANPNLKQVIFTYHPNARGDSGIKMKYFIEKLTASLLEI